MSPGPAAPPFPDRDPKFLVDVEGKANVPTLFPSMSRTASAWAGLMRARTLSKAARFSEARSWMVAFPKPLRWRQRGE